MSDLFRFFNKANDGDMRYVDKMTDEEVKGIAPFVLLGWGMGAENDTEAHTILTNEYMNDKVFSLSKHPRLLLKLFVAANGDLGFTKYKFVKNKSPSNSKEVMAIASYYGVGYREAADYARILDEEEKDTIMKIEGER